MKLAIFFTFGVSIENWKSTGMFDREIKYISALCGANAVSNLTLFTYSHLDEIYLDAVSERLPNVALRIVQLARSRNPLIVIGSLIRIRSLIRDIDVLRANQMIGSMRMLLIGLIMGKPSLVRSGYVPSKYLKLRGNLSLVKRVYHYVNEACVSYFADAIIISSLHDQTYFFENYPLSRSKLNLIPNYVDIEPPSEIDFSHREDVFVFAGRLEKEKNVEALVTAFNKLGRKLIVVGSGSLEAQLKSIAVDNIEFRRNLENFDLIELFKSSKYFVLPSLVEGMPKVLIEAMASGCVCLGSPTPGISEIIKDDHSGHLLSGFSADNIIQGVNRVIGSENNHISRNAIGQANSQYSLYSVVKSESGLLQKMMGE